MQGLSVGGLKLRPETERNDMLKGFLLYPITYIRLVGLVSVPLAVYANSFTRVRLPCMY